MVIRTHHIRSYLSLAAAEGDGCDVDRPGPRLGTLRDPREGTPRVPLGRLVRRNEPHQRGRRHHQHPGPGDRPGRAAWRAAPTARHRPAADLGHATRPQSAAPIHYATPRKERDMNATLHTPAATRPPMDPMRQRSLAAGILYLITFVSIPSLALYKPVKDQVGDFVLGAGSDTGVMWAA